MGIKYEVVYILWASYAAQVLGGDRESNRKNLCIGSSQKIKYTQHKSSAHMGFRLISVLTGNRFI